MKKGIVLLCLLLLSGCACSASMKPSSTPTPSPSASAETVKEAKDVTGEETSFGTPIVSLKMKEGKIIEISIDEITGETTKKSLGDEYKLSESAVDTWANQIKALEEYILSHDINEISTDTNGKALDADLLAGCTIQIENYLKTVRKAMNEAK